MPGYLSLWRIEETIRFVKQSYGFENLRVMSYASIRNMVALVLVSAYFAAYSIADGLKRAFTRFGKWIRTFGKTNAIDTSETNTPMLPGFAALPRKSCHMTPKRNSVALR